MVTSRAVVGYEQVWLSYKCHGYADALLHAAGKLKWVFVLALRRDTDELEHLVHALGLFLAAQLRKVQVQHLSQLFADGLGGVEARHWVLKYHGYFVAAYLLELLLGELQHVPAFKNDASGADLADTVRQQPEYAQREGGLACTGLADEAETLALFKHQVQAVQRVYGAVVGVVIYI